jgi:hypothetical protein
MSLVLSKPMYRNPVSHISWAGRIKIVVWWIVCLCVESGEDHMNASDSPFQKVGASGLTSSAITTLAVMFP